MSSVSSFSNQPPPRPPDQMDPRREKLHGLKQREDMKDALLQRYGDRYGGRGAVADEVERFVGSAAPMTAANLQRLERRLQRQADGRGGGISGLSVDGDAMSICSVSAYTNGSGRMSEGLGSLGGGGSVGRRKVGGLLTPRGVAGDMVAGRGAAVMTPMSYHHIPTPRSSDAGSYSAREYAGDRGYAASSVGGAEGGPGLEAQTGPANSLEWAVLDKLAAQMHKQDAAKQREREMELQRRLREDLQKQMVDVQVKQDREKERDRQYHEMQVDSYTQWQQQEMEKSAIQKDKFLVQQKERDVQLKELQEKKKAAKAEEHQDAQNLVSKLLGDTEVERKRVEARWANRRDQAMRALDVSSQSAAVRADKEKVAIQTDQDRLLRHQRLQEEREIQETERKKKEQSKIQAREHIGAETFAQQKSKAEIAAMKATTERREKEQRDIRIEDENNQRRAKQKLETQAYLLQQMRDKQSAKQVEQQRRIDLRNKHEQDAENFHNVEHMRDQEKRGRNVEHRAELERQIANKMGSTVGPKKSEVMSEVELRLNKSLLQRVNMALSEISDSPDGRKARQESWRSNASQVSGY